MKPEEPESRKGGMPLSQQGPTSDTTENQPDKSSQDAAAQLIRSQIDNLYSDQNSSQHSPKPDTTIDESTQLEDINPYLRTHSENPDITAKDWSHYHTAWQNYYQKYYEGYYVHHLNKARQVVEDQGSTTSSQPKQEPSSNHAYFKNNAPSKSEPEKVFSPDEAIFDMRQQLLGKVYESATRIKKSRHFVPIFSGLIVVLIFVLLQYNSLIASNVMAYVSPGNIDPQNIIINPNADLVVGPEPKLIIPKINVDVPVLYDVGSDYDSQMAAMSNGVAHFAIPGANSHPGQIGNTVLSGHSSNDLLDIGDYKFIFAQLDRLNINDTIYLNYRSIRYTYVVTKKEVVKPTDVNKLIYPTTKPILTLLTCTPVGTSLNRLLVTTEQISPDPSKSIIAPVGVTPTAKTKSIPGNTPSFLERLFGAR